MNKINKAQFERYKQEHWNLWNWLVKYPGKNKIDWCDMNGYVYAQKSALCL